MAERTGLEPATPCVTGRYSNRLNYRSTEFFYNHRFYDRLTAKFDAWQFPTLAWGDPTLPSALRRFTSEFGMGSGGTTALRPPGKFCFINTSRYDLLIQSVIKLTYRCLFRQNIFGVVRLSLTVH